MKKYQYILVAVTALLFAACDKSLETVEPDLEVTGYTVTDGIDSLGNPVKNVTFSLTGDAKILSFYSGEMGHDYDYRNGRIVDYSSLLLSFSTTIQYGTQPNQFSVWVSTDFNGNYSPADVNAAIWEPLEGFELASAVGSTTPVPSGVKDITNKKVEGKPLYIGFKYVTEPQLENGAQNTWRVRNFLLKGQSDLGELTMAEQTTAGWLIVNDGEIIDPGRAMIEGGSVVVLRGNNINTEVKTTSWAISKAFDTNSTNLGPDRPVDIKAYIDPTLTSYTYQYTQPGNYTVAFVAQNSTLKESKQVVKTMNIIIN